MTMAESDIAAVPDDAHALQDLLQRWRQERKIRKGQSKRPSSRRSALSTAQRARVRAKTGGRCHVCGGLVHNTWQAEHVLAHSGGGEHAEDNYLPAHALCNNYRWDYLPEEFQYILKLGVWARTHIEKGSRLGWEIAGAFVAYESRRRARRVGGQPVH